LGLRDWKRLGNVKSQVHPITCHEGTDGIEVQLYSSFNLGARAVGGQWHTATASSPEMTRYPLYRRIGGRQGRSGRVREMSAVAEFDPRTVQPVASRYKD
jgi:hypothetical protein